MHEVQLSRLFTQVAQFDEQGRHAAPFKKYPFAQAEHVVGENEHYVQAELQFRHWLPDK